MSLGDLLLKPITPLLYLGITFAILGGTVSNGGGNPWGYLLSIFPYFLGGVWLGIVYNFNRYRTLIDNVIEANHGLAEALDTAMREIEIARSAKEETDV